MFNQIFLSLQVKRYTIITYKHGIFKLPRKLQNDLTLKRLGWRVWNLVDPFCSFSKNVYSNERVKPCFFVTFNIILTLNPIKPAGKGGGGIFACGKFDFKFNLIPSVVF